MQEYSVSAFKSWSLSSSQENMESFASLHFPDLW